MLFNTAERFKILLAHPPVLGDFNLLDFIVSVKDNGRGVNQQSGNITLQVKVNPAGFTPYKGVDS